MSEAFLKSIKWLVMAVCAVVGTSAFIISDNTGSIKPVLLGILTYGVIYIMSYFWEEFRGRLLLYSIFVFLGLSFASAYVPEAMHVLFGYPVRLFDPFYVWGITVAGAGLPIMTFVFYKYD